MTTERESNGTWLEDLKDLIRKKQEENVALKKIQESLQTRGGAKDATDDSPVDEDQEGSGPDEDRVEIHTEED